MKPAVSTTVNMATMPLRRGHFRVLAVASLGQLIGQGLATLVGIIIPMVQLAVHPGLSSTLQGIMGSMSLIGLMIGTVVFGRLTDRFGYLFFFRLCPVLIIAASVTAYFFHSVPVLLACLFVMGFSVGGEYSLDSDYISELMPDRYKEFMVGVAKASASVGSVIVAAVCYWLINAWHQADPWPDLLFILTGISGVTLLLRIRFYQSPGWLMAHGRTAQAEQAVRRFLGPDVTMTPPPQSAVTSTTAADGSLGAFIKRNFSRIIFSGVPWACEGFGVYGIGIFLPILIMALGLNGLPASAPRIDHIISSVEVTILLSAVMIAGFAIGLAMVRRTYHPALQTWGFVLSAAGLAILLLAYRLHWPAWVAIGGFILFELALNAGPHLITFILPTQIYPVAERGTGVGMAAGVGKSGAVAGAFIIPLLLQWGGSTLVLAVAIGAMAIGAVVTAVLAPRILPRK